MKRWIVTGGVGFIGYHLTRALVTRGTRVTVIDDFCDAPYPAAEKRLNERDLVQELGDLVEVVTVSVTDRAGLAPHFENVEGVVHLAGLAGVRRSFEDPARYARVNVEGTATILELARGYGIPRVVFASSSSVYGNSTPLPATEDAPAIIPESPYAASKRGAELVASAIARITPAMAIAALRFFSVYGPRQRPDMAITIFTRACVAGRPIVMFGEGSMRRDFTHVDDIVRGVLAAIDRAPSGYRAYNLGSGSPISLASLVAAIGHACGREPRVEQAPVPLGDVDATFADIERARVELDWSPRVPLDLGLKSVVEWVTAHP